MLVFYKKLRAAQNLKREEGFTIVEIMVATIIVAMVLIFSAVVITSGVKTTATFEARSKAQNLAASVVSIAQQTPYRQLWLDRTFVVDSTHPAGDFIDADNEKGKCSPTAAPAPAHGAWATSGETGPYQRPDTYAPGGLTYCTKTQFGTATGTAVGTTYYIQTDISYVQDATVAAGYETNESGADTSSFNTGAVPAVAPNVNSPTPPSNSYQPRMYYAKRVTVTVRWFDISNSGATGQNGFNTVTMSYTAVPDPSECVPGTFNIAGTKIVWQGTVRPTGTADNPGTPDIDEGITRSFAAPPGCAP